MPELPEVEVTRRNLERWLSGRRVIRAEAERTRTFRGSRPELFEELRGRLLWASRRGKYLLLEFEGGRGLLVHLGMTGKLVKRQLGTKEPHSRARLVLDDGEVVHLLDTRLFARIEAAPAKGLRELPAIAALGIDALEDGLTPKKLEQAIGDSRQDLKVALMDQSRIAGLGNLHAAEALFRAGLHPARKPASLSKEEWRRLCRAIRDGISFAIERETAEEMEYVEEPGAENPFTVYGRGGEPCLRCGKTVRSITQGGRTTYFCPSCQRKRGRSR
ncbi:MAG: bifunctional DNA-formamidopyrimidine glycosylase/DNA-(apurinic or apyrimidinic site) lyase [Myxococcales bacterium]|nr:bifunctional DNA-formamidopyrimidine glycosylase/DNA-(apurinic or apyrimidinic site) lyase [Myxococcales bacterium]